MTKKKQVIETRIEDWKIAAVGKNNWMLFNIQSSIKDTDGVTRVGYIIYIDNELKRINIHKIKDWSRLLHIFIMNTPSGRQKAINKLKGNTVIGRVFFETNSWDKMVTCLESDIIEDIDILSFPQFHAMFWDLTSKDFMYIIQEYKDYIYISMNERVVKNSTGGYEYESKTFNMEDM